MIVLPDNAAELAILARDIGAEVLTGRLDYPSETGGGAISISTSTWRTTATSRSSSSSRRSVPRSRRRTAAGSAAS